MRGLWSEGATTIFRPRQGSGDASSFGLATARFSSFTKGANSPTCSPRGTTFRLLTARFSSFTKRNHLVSARHRFPSWTRQAFSLAIHQERNLRRATAPVLSLTDRGMRQAFLSSIKGAICDPPGFSSSIESAICDAPGFSSSIKSAILRRAAAPYSSSTTDCETMPRPPCSPTSPFAPRHDTSFCPRQ